MTSPAWSQDATHHMCSCCTPFQPLHVVEANRMPQGHSRHKSWTVQERYKRRKGQSTANSTGRGSRSYGLGILGLRGGGSTGTAGGVSISTAGGVSVRTAGGGPKKA